ncbi:unnamed protein product [Allacma fusca]|uniref:Protein vein n=1 Tax=Allacma fusca TaxID=39272 RepID=A0A8J2PTF2_9HEXA|nr:unnamed protein product [Allacma fusca]
MKFINRVLWALFLFLLLLSSFPFRVDCRSMRAIRPGSGPSQSRSAVVSTRKLGSSSSFIFVSSDSLPMGQHSGNSSSSSSSSGSSSSSSSSSSGNSGSSNSSPSSSSVESKSNMKACPFLENKFSMWSELYRPDITMKVWETTLVLEGIARSRSEVKPDGTFGVTFDMHRIVKGDAPLLRQRKQFRLQFLDNSDPSSPPLTNNNVNVKLRSSSSSLQNSTGIKLTDSHLHSNKNNHKNRIVIQSQHKRNNTFPNSRNVYQSGSPNGPGALITRTTTSSRVNKCAPPKAIVKTGRRYFVFASKWENRFVAVYSPELANKKNTKLVNSVLCKECRQAPSVGATKEIVLKAKERIRIRCRLRAGNPVPALTWYKDGRPVNLNENRYRLRVKRRQSVLVIRKTRESDIGEYKCEAKNYLGSADAITSVFLRKTPRKKHGSTSTSSPSLPSKAGTTPTTLWPDPSTPCPIDSYCLNGGTCSYYENIGELVCQCAEGYKGQRCDTKDISTSGIQFPWLDLPSHNTWRKYHQVPADRNLYGDHL